MSAATLCARMPPSRRTATGPLNTVDGSDVVLWVVIRHHHEPRERAEEKVAIGRITDAHCLNRAARLRDLPRTAGRRS